MKSQILEAIGESDLSRAAQVDAALAANDRVKYYFSLLQMAKARADDPEQPCSNLRRERRACGIDDSCWDDVPGAAHREGAGYRIPGCAKMLDRITQELRVMAAPLVTEVLAEFAPRLERLLGNLPELQGDLIKGQAIELITRAGSEKADSVHQLVMDLHKRLNAMQADLAEQRVDGAAVYHADDGDHPLISAFMAGVNRTAPLKFDHPGLDTTVTRSGPKLIIQNDIGCTDAHVIVIHVEGLAVTVTYTDVHAERAQFFREMLGRYPVSWNGDRQGRLPSEGKPSGKDADADFAMLVGTFVSSGQAELEQYLTFLGSRLVFLIDWNRARKQLRGFLRGPERVAVLRWAATEEVGHRAFLELGGARLINQAIEHVAGSALHFGDRLCDVLGNDAATEFAQFVFRAALEGLRERQSPRLIHDRICAELQAHFASEGQRLLLLAGEHAGLVFELASQVREGIRPIAGTGGCGESPDFLKLGKRARAFEHDADQLVIAAREAVRRRPEYSALFKIAETADDAADELEQAAFLLGLFQESKPEGDALDALSNLGNILVEGAQEWVKVLTAAARVKKAGHPEDAGDFLLSVDRLLALEHQADDAERALTYVSVQRARNFRQLHLYAEIGKSLEAAADALKSAALMTRDHLFATVLGA